MPVNYYLRAWDLCELCERFKTTSFLQFLAIPHADAVKQYGATFATHHQQLCKSLRNTLYRKRMIDTAHAGTNGDYDGNSNQRVSSLTRDMRTLLVDESIPTRNWADNSDEEDETASCTSAKSRLESPFRSYATEDAELLPTSPWPLEAPRAPVKNRLGQAPKRRWYRTRKLRRNLHREFEQAAAHGDDGRVSVKDRLGGYVTTNMARYKRRRRRRRSSCNGTAYGTGGKSEWGSRRYSNRS